MMGAVAMDSIPGGTVELDDFDRRLLDALQADNRRTGEELADIVGLSPAACLRRAQRLRDEKVIERDVSILAPEALGRRLTVIVLVTLERESPDVVDAFKRSMRQAPEVMQCYYVIVRATENWLISAVFCAIESMKWPPGCHAG